MSGPPRSAVSFALAGLDPAIHVCRRVGRKQRGGRPGQARGSGVFIGPSHALLALALLLCLAIPAHAVRPDEMLKDPVLEARAREIGQELRCLVCRNQSIDDSDADLAHDLRVLVRQRLTAGDTDQQVTDYIVSRYGDFVLLKPPFKLDTWVLWLGPGLVLLAGLWGLGRYMRRQAGMSGPPPLSADEDRRLAKILKDGAEP
jgi:cytochrome c-type biogenesis protein CcmH